MNYLLVTDCFGRDDVYRYTHSEMEEMFSAEEREALRAGRVVKQPYRRWIDMRAVAIAAMREAV